MTSGDSEIPRDSDTHNQRVSNGGGLAWGRTLVYLLVTVLAAIVIVLSFYLPSLSNDESDTGITRLSQPSQAFIPEHATSQYADTGEGPQDVASYCPAVRESTDPYFGTQQRASLLARLNDPSTQTHSGHISVSSELARDHLRFGEAEEAIFILTQALEVEGRDDPDGKHRPELLKALGVANMKLGELNNCLSASGRLICALPLDRSFAHKNQRGSRGAIKYLLQYLESRPDDLTARWLLNIAHMTLGTYPEEVPGQHLVPTEALESAYDVGRFDEIAPDVGLYAVNPAGGSIVEDFDNDGLLDIMTSTWDPCQPIAYYHNQGDGAFADYTTRAGLTG